MGNACVCDGICDGARSPVIASAQTVNNLAMAHRIDEMESELRVQMSDNKRLKLRCEELEEQLTRNQTMNGGHNSLLDSDYGPPTSSARIDSYENQKIHEALRNENEALRTKIRLLARA